MSLATCSPIPMCASDEEQRFFQALRGSPDRGAWADLYLACLPLARAEVLHRLASSIVREGLLPVAPGPSRGGSYEYCAALGDRHIVFEFSGDAPFGRFPRLEACFVRSETRVTRITAPLALVDLLLTAVTGVDERALHRYRLEVDNGVANMALSLAAHRLTQSQNLSAGVLTLAQWLASHPDQDSRRRALEQEVHTGHRLHTGAKTRLGMSPRDVLRSVPELRSGPVALRWVALRASACQTSGEDTQAILESLWPSTVATCRAELAAQGFAANDYRLLPVHPWQFENVVQPNLQGRLDPEVLICLTPESRAHPQLSLRTLEPVTEAGHVAPHHLKLPIGVQTTSAERTVSPQSVANGPRISSVLAAIVQQAPMGLDIIAEVAGLGLDPNHGAPAIGADLARHLSVIVRTNPSSISDGPGDNWLCAALAANPTFGAGALITQYVRYGFRMQSRPCLFHDWVQTFWRRYCHALLRPVLILMARFGVGLEAHGQNALMCFDEDGLPCRLRIRDFGGVRISLPDLRAAGHDLRLFENSAPEASRAEVANKILHTAVQMHLVDILQALERDGLHVDRPWAVVRGVIEDVYETENLQAEWTRDARLLLAPSLEAKCLLRMRLCGAYRDYLYHPVDNHLAAEPRDPGLR